jgi:sulfatase modifying factor 1
MRAMTLHSGRGWTTGRCVAAALLVGMPAACAGLVVACSSSSGALCGAGTSLENGECVVAADASGGPDSATSLDGGADGNALSDGGCPGNQGPAMVRVPLPEGGSFCIDTTEVTLAQYNAFLTATAGDMSAQPASCAWNTSYSPPSGCMDGGWQDDFPVACVNWCDAYAYCAWAGKNLCGGVNNVLPATWAQAQTSWACSTGGENLYPYGNTFEDGVCQEIAVGDTPQLQGPVPVASKTGCHAVDAPFSEVFDLVGNVDEWLACDPTQGDCAVQFGSWSTPWPAETANCSTAALGSPDAASPAVGLRCCSDYHQNGM